MSFRCGPDSAALREHIARLHGPTLELLLRCAPSAEYHLVFVPPARLRFSCPMRINDVHCAPILSSWPRWPTPRSTARLYSRLITAAMPGDGMGVLPTQEQGAPVRPTNQTPLCSARLTDLVAPAPDSRASWTARQRITKSGHAQPRRVVAARMLQGITRGGRREIDPSSPVWPLLNRHDAASVTSRSMEWLSPGVG